MSAMSSTHSPILGKRSLTSVPLFPRGLKFQKAGRYLLLPFSYSSFSLGLGSKESTCETPPVMNRKITRLALAGKCGVFGESGLSSPRASTESRCEKTAGIIIEPQNSDLIYTSDAADERSSVDLGGRRIIK